MEERVLSSHGPFSSKSVYPNADAGVKGHLANMESMAEEVNKHAFDKVPLVGGHRWHSEE